MLDGKNLREETTWDSKEDNIKIFVKRIRCRIWTGFKWLTLGSSCGNEHSYSIRDRKFVDQVSD
jgi:hypothetical protein